MRPNTRSKSKNTQDKVPAKKSPLKKRKEADGEHRPRPKVDTTKKSNKIGKDTERKLRRGSVSLSAYFKSYKGGLGDFHIPIFRDLKRITSPNYVLYPGCHRHVSASLVFPNVVYVDNYAKVQPLFSDEKVLEFVNENKVYTEEPIIKFKCKNFESNIGEKDGSFDLLLSLSAGIVSKPCAKYLKSGGYLLAGDAHYDARMAFVDPRFSFIGVYDDTKNEFDLSDEGKSGHFVTKKGDNITAEMVQESINVVKSKRSFKLQKESLFYLFKKN